MVDMKRASVTRLRPGGRDIERLAGLGDMTLADLRRHDEKGHDVMREMIEAASEPGGAERGTSGKDPDALSIYVVYDHPIDYPDHFVVRRWAVGDHGVAPAGDPLRQDTRIEALRDWLEHEKGLQRTARHPQDDPVILEVWV